MENSTHIDFFDLFEATCLFLYTLITSVFQWVQKDTRIQWWYFLNDGYPCILLIKYKNTVVHERNRAKNPSNKIYWILRFSERNVVKTSRNAFRIRSTVKMEEWIAIIVLLQYIIRQLQYITFHADSAESAWLNIFFNFFKYLNTLPKLVLNWGKIFFRTKKHWLPEARSQNVLS